MNHLKKHHESYLIFGIIVLSILIRFYFAGELQPAVGGGDSSTRANITMGAFPFDYHWRVGGFWPPFYFIIYSIPLYIHYSLKSLVLFQLLLSSSGLIVYFYLLRNTFSKSIAFVSTLVIALSPIHILLSVSVLSEILFLLLTFLGLFFYQKSYSLNQTKNLSLSFLFLVISTMVRFEAWFILAFVLLFHWLTRKEFKVSVPFLLLFLCFFGFYEYFSYQEEGYFLSYLLANPEEARAGNRHVSVFSTIDLIIRFSRIAFENVGIVGIFILLIGLLSQFIKINIYKVFSLAVTLPFIYAVITHSIAAWNRYLIGCLIFLIPLGLNLINSLKKRNKWLKVLIVSLSPLMIFAASRNASQFLSFRESNSVIRGFDKVVDRMTSIMELTPEAHFFIDQRPIEFIVNDFKSGVLERDRNLQPLTENIHFLISPYKLEEDPADVTEKQVDIIKENLNRFKEAYVVLYENSPFSRVILPKKLASEDFYFEGFHFKPIFHDQKTSLYKVKGFSNE